MNKKKFYIIGRYSSVAGICSYIGSSLTHIAYAFDNNMIPIVDLQHYRNQYFKDGREYKDNTWEYFFEQPSQYTLNDIDENSECIISSNKYTSEPKYSLTCQDLPIDTFKSINERINILRERYKNYIKFNKEMTEYIEPRYNKIIGDNKNILGVLARGTDYIFKKPYGENKTPNPQKIIKKVKVFLKKHPEISKIYIATEDAEIYEMFKTEFGDMLIDNNQYRYKYDKKTKNFLADIKVNRPNHNYELAKEYLLSLYILSKCKYFVGGRCTGTKIAWILSDDWKDMYIWQLGKYGKLTNLEKIFSVTDYSRNNETHNVVSFLGLKMTYKQ